MNLSPGSNIRWTRVPVEHRLLGLDKRSFPYAFFVIAVFIVAAIVVPRVNDAIAWDDPVVAGDELALTSSIAFTPTIGWNVESGHRLGKDGAVGQKGEATLVGEGVNFSIVPDSFDGTPAALLNQITRVTSSTDDSTFHVDGTPTTVTTTSGEVGVMQPYSSVRGDGLVAAFVIDGTGLKTTVFGTPAQMSLATADIDAMIASIRTLEGSGS